MLSGGVTRGLAIALSALAGFVDAMGFLSLGGFYVAFMSGNSTILSIGLATRAGPQIELAAGLVAGFVAGVAGGTLAGKAFGPWRAGGVLVVVAALLAGAAGLQAGGFLLAGGIVMAVAMGAENTVFHRDGQAGIGLTYMTGTLVRLGQRLSEAVTGGGWRGVVPDLLLWGGMLAGAFAGAALFEAVGPRGLWVAVLAALAMAGVAARSVRSG